MVLSARRPQSCLAHRQNDGLQPGSGWPSFPSPQSGRLQTCSSDASSPTAVSEQRQPQHLAASCSACFPIVLVTLTSDKVFICLLLASPTQQVSTLGAEISSLLQSRSVTMCHGKFHLSRTGPCRPRCQRLPRQKQAQRRDPRLRTNLRH